ncbi:MAG: hypothetical protein AVDCRST_MAG53-1002, partial [uncultured Solirubrobacteraceae bacterium]
EGPARRAARVRRARRRLRGAWRRRLRAQRAARRVLRPRAGRRERCRGHAPARGAQRPGGVGVRPGRHPRTPAPGAHRRERDQRERRAAYAGLPCRRSWRARSGGARRTHQRDRAGPPARSGGRPARRRDRRAAVRRRRPLWV